MTFNIYINKVLSVARRVLPFYLFTFLPLTISAQDKIINPDISYAGTPRTCEIAGIAVEGVEGYEDYDECSNYCTIVLTSHASKIILKIPRLQQYVNQELPDVPVEFRKGRGTRD